MMIYPIQYNSTKTKWRPLYGFTVLWFSKWYNGITKRKILFNCYEN